jgi:hypothetical protein
MACGGAREEEGSGVGNSSLVKPFAIAGVVAAEIYMVFTVLAPHLPGDEMPVAAAIRRMLVLSIFFGPFGLAVGTGIGLLVQGLVNVVRRRKTDPAAPSPKE